jgi:hypothetical protein
VATFIRANHRWRPPANVNRYVNLRPQIRTTAQHYPSRCPLTSHSAKCRRTSLKCKLLFLLFFFSRQLHALRAPAIYIWTLFVIITSPCTSDVLLPVTVTRYRTRPSSGFAMSSLNEFGWTRNALYARFSNRNVVSPWRNKCTTCDYSCLVRTSRSACVKSWTVESCAQSIFIHGELSRERVEFNDRLEYWVRRHINWQPEWARERKKDTAICMFARNAFHVFIKRKHFNTICTYIVSLNLYTLISVFTYGAEKITTWIQHKNVKKKQ